MTTQDFKTEQIPGWYSDPWGAFAWRWWDGSAWTANVSLRKTGEPKLPNWLSLPVVISAFLSIPLILVFIYLNPVAGFLALMPLVLLFVMLWVLNLVAPQPWSSRIHALLWGALVATLISGFFNTVVAIILGEQLATIASAPIVEEATKGLAVIWALRRKEIDGIVDGVTYSTLVALGFAVVENITYFASTPDFGSLLYTFFLRGVLSPFAHPLFTFWIGLGVGLSVRWQQSTFAHVLWGYPLAVVGHASWNGGITYSIEIGEENLVWFAYPVYLVLFLTVLGGMFLILRRQQRVFVQQIPILASRYQISEPEVEIFGDWRKRFATRRQLSSPQRRNFDRLHASLSKLALAHGGPGKVSRTQEELLASQLQSARMSAFTTAKIPDRP